MPANWTAVGDAITERLEELGMQQKELAALSRVSVATLREMQRGVNRRRSPRILPDISVALRWPADYLDGVLQGRQPDQESHGTQVSASEPSAFLAKLAFILEHRFGRIVDVIYNSDSDIDITIEIRHSPRER